MVDLRLDVSWSRPGDGHVALGGSPLTLFRLTPAGVRVIESLERGEPLPQGHQTLTDRLVAAGAVHPVVHWRPDADRPAARDVSVVIPAHDEDHGSLADLVASLNSCAVVAAVIVVDDASRVPVAALDGAEVVRLDRNVGPAGARTAGIDRCATPFVLCVDADVTLPDADLTVGVMRRHMDDDRVGLVAPRVAAAEGTGLLARYEAMRSPLDLGPEPARIRPLTRVSYVPAATILLRRSALDQVGGFDSELRLGEDVDLVWRLDAAGWSCRYEPAVVVRHAVRSTVTAWLRQRRLYGTSAAALHRRHPGAVAPVRLDRWSLGAWALAAGGHPVAGAATACATTAMFGRTLVDVPQRWTVAARYAGLGNLHAGRLLAASCTRTWWPIALCLAVVSRRARRAVLLAVLVPALHEWVTKRPSFDPVRHLLLRVLDDGAYGAGVWQGCLRERDVSALLPSLTRH